MTDQLAEYESQLSDVNEMIALDPTNPSLSQLRNDLLELITITKSGGGGDTAEEEVAADTSTDGTARSVPVGLSESTHDSSSYGATSTDGTPFAASTATSTHYENGGKDDGDDDDDIPDEPPLILQKTNDVSHQQPPAAAVAAAASTTEKSKKKKSKTGTNIPSQFVVPDHLIPLESESESKKKHKRRTIKALKRKWKERVREAELGQKQNTWQDFNKKASKKKKGGGAAAGAGSIFATEDGVNARVGVTGSGRTMTDYAKRAKHG